MNHRPDIGLVDAQSEGERPHQNAFLSGHPQFLMSIPGIRRHLPMVGKRRESTRCESRGSLFHSLDGGGVDNHVAFGIMLQRGSQKLQAVSGIEMNKVAEIRPMKTQGDLSGIAETELRDNIVPHPARGACGKRGDRNVGKTLAEHPKLAVLRPEFMSPFGNAMRFVDSEKRQRKTAQPGERVIPHQALRREIKEPEFSLFGAPLYLA